MKKVIYTAAAILCLGLAFLTGYWLRSPDSTRTGNPSTTSPIPAASVDPSTMAPGTVEMRPEKQQLLGVRTDVVGKSSETATLRVLGLVAADETRIYRINSAVDCWIRKTYSKTTGSVVQKGEVLASFYSPEFLSTEQAYIFALSSFDRFHSSGRESPQQIELTGITIQQYKDTLSNLGMSDIQIEEIGRTRAYTENIQIRSPATGFILYRNLSTGERIEKGKELYRIADLRRVWILADLFENEAKYVKPGALVKVTLPGRQEVFHAKVTNVLPQFDPSTRTLKVRLEADNPGYVLRPDMFVDVDLPVTFPPAVTVPADAVLDAGIRKTVFVDLGNGLFEPREVETGWRFANRVEIVKGLEPGERIVVSGNFLIDSESRMELAAAGMSGTLEKDPVCGAVVSVKKALKEGKASVHQGKTYYFSSSECKEKFDRDPDRYAAKPVEGND
jgi:membrane fusion protein, copper/silver efflux system